MIPSPVLNLINSHNAAPPLFITPDAHIFLNREPDLVAECRRILLEWGSSSPEEREKRMTVYLQTKLPEYRKKLNAPGKDVSEMARKQAMLTREHELLKFLGEVYEPAGGLVGWLDRFYRPWFARFPDTVPTKEYYKCLYSFQHGGIVSSISSFPDGRIVSGGVVGIIKVWTPEKTPESTINWREERLVSGEAKVTAIHALPDGRIIVAGTDGIRVWEKASDGKWCASFIATDVPVSCVHGLPDGSIISGSSISVQIWTPARKSDGGLLWLPESVYSPSPVNCMHVLPDGRAFVGLENGQVCSVFRSGNLKWKMKGTGIAKRETSHRRAIKCLQVLNEEQIATSSGDILLWNKGIGFLGRTVWHNSPVHATINFVTCFLITQAGSLFFGDSAGWLNKGQMAKRGEAGYEVLRYEVLEHCGSLNSIQLLPDGRLISGSADGCVRVWDGKERS